MGEFLDILKLQPDFQVMRSGRANLRGADSLDPWTSPGEFVDVGEAIRSYHPRARITNVEVEYDVSGLDVARVTIVDPEYEVISLANWDYLWKVSVGYVGLEKSKWATLVGVPQIEVPQFPREGEPTITVVILGVVVRMTKHHTFTPQRIDDFICKPADIAEIRAEKYDPIKKAVARIAASHGLTAFFGIPRPYDALTVVDSQHRPDDVLDRLFPLQETLNDAEYLNRIVAFLNEKELELKKKRVQEQWAKPTFRPPNELSPPPVLALDEDEYRWGQLGDKLVLAKWKRDVWDSVFGVGGKVVPVFQYRYGNMALLEFRPRLSRTEAERGLKALGINKQTGEVEVVQIDHPTKQVEEMETDPFENPNVKKEQKTLQANEVKPDHILLFSVGPDRVEMELDLNRVWERQRLDIEGDAILLGYPPLRAGMLVCFGGLGKAPSSMADVPEPQKFFSLNRIYLITRVTHRLDAQTGKYRTLVSVVSTTSSEYDRSSVVEAMASLDTPQKDGFGNKFVNAFEVERE